MLTITNIEKLKNASVAALQITTVIKAEDEYRILIEGMDNRIIRQWTIDRKPEADGKYEITEKMGGNIEWVTPKELETMNGLIEVLKTKFR